LNYQRISCIYRERKWHY